MKTIFAFLMMTAAAQAQTVTMFGPSASTAWTVPGLFCHANGRTWEAKNGLCLMEDADRSIAPLTGLTTNAVPRPQCEDGWMLVDAGRPMCARELKEPK